MSGRIIATNRKAYHNYIIFDGIEAGIQLTGTEIKSIRDGKVNLSDSYIKPENGEMWLINSHIAQYESRGYQTHDPIRKRRLLLHRKQINELTSKAVEKGLTIVPTKLYINKSLAKVEIALAKGKKLFDKRESIARRENERELGRVLKKAV